MTQHVRALFVHDDEDRLLRINDWREGAAPRFYLGKSARGVIWRVRRDISDALAGRLQSLAGTEPAGLDRPVHERDYLNILSAPVSAASFGPTYSFQQIPIGQQNAILINTTNSRLLENGLDDWIADVPFQQPFAAVIHNGQAVSVCASVRITGRVHEAGVETLAAFRNRGFAVAAVARWAQAVHQLGALPMYSTSFENLASQGVARRLGLVQYGVESSIT